MSDPVGRLLDRLDKVRQAGPGSWTARCPAHDDNNPSLSITAKPDRVLVHCHAGCGTDEVTRAVGLEITDLFSDEAMNGHRHRRAGDTLELVDTYTYLDATGQPNRQVRKYRTADGGKTFRQYRHTPGGWQLGVKGRVPMIPYRLPELRAAIEAGRTIYLTEGEKDADAVAATGLEATTTPQGAGKWDDDLTPHFAGAHVIVWADNDRPGRNHARLAATCLTPVAASVRCVVNPAGRGNDAAELLGMGGTVDEVEPLDDIDSPEPADGPAPIDWAEFWATEPVGTEWLIEPFIPAARQTALFSRAKAGKSLLALEAAAAIATGRPFLARPEGPPQPVVYFDWEQTAADLRERLEAFGYGPDDNLDHLHYYLLPPIAALDSEAGGTEIERIVEHHDAALVVIDTMARVVAGNENDSDTYRHFYKHCGIRLKRNGRTLLRLDHAGKDNSKGQRGSSSKNDDVDVILKLTVDNNTLTLNATSRVGWVPATTRIRRQEDDQGMTHHRLAIDVIDNTTRRLVAELDRLGIPETATRREAAEALRAVGSGARNESILAAQRHRKRRGPKQGPTKSVQLGDQNVKSETTQQTSGDQSEDRPGTSPLVDGDLGPSPKRGTRGPRPDPDTEQIKVWKC